MKNYNIHEIMSNKEIQKQFIKYLIVGGFRLHLNYYCLPS